jgi:hypothetical protein
LEKRTAPLEGKKEEIKSCLDMLSKHEADDVNNRKPPSPRKGTGLNPGI